MTLSQPGQNIRSEQTKAELSQSLKSIWGSTAKIMVELHKNLMGNVPDNVVNSFVSLDADAAKQFNRLAQIESGSLSYTIDRIQEKVEKQQDLDAVMHISSDVSKLIELRNKLLGDYSEMVAKQKATITEKIKNGDSVENIQASLKTMHTDLNKFGDEIKKFEDGIETKRDELAKLHKQVVASAPQDDNAAGFKPSGGRQQS